VLRNRILYAALALRIKHDGPPALFLLLLQVMTMTTELNKAENLYYSLYVHHMGPSVALASERIQKFI
jgi:hypothetical protein